MPQDHLRPTSWTPSKNARLTAAPTLLVGMVKPTDKAAWKPIPSDGDEAADASNSTPVAPHRRADRAGGMARGLESALGARTLSVLKPTKSAVVETPQSTPLDPTSSSSSRSNGSVSRQPPRRAQASAGSHHRRNSVTRALKKAFYYQHVPGKSRFLCGGRCMLGPKIDNNYMLFAWCAILIPSGFFFWLGAPVIWRRWGMVLPS